MLYDSKSSKLYSPTMDRIKLDAMETVQIQHKEVQDYTDQVNDKTLLAIEMEEERLNQRYYHLLNQLEKTKLQILKLEEKLRLQNDLENHPQIKQIVSELSKVDQYRLALIKKTNLLNQGLQLNRCTIKELRTEVQKKKIEIRDCVRECWQTQQLICLSKQTATQSTARTQRFQYHSLDSNSNRSHLNLFITENSIKKLSLSQLPPIYVKQKNKSELLKVLSKASFGGQSQSAHDIIDIYKQISILRNKITEAKLEVKQKSNQFNSIKDLFNDCAKLSLKQFRNKQKVTDQDGYANSIYFDFNTTANQSIIDQSNQNNKKERKIQNILYDTLQQIIVKMIDQQQSTDSNGNSLTNSIIRNSVSLEQFMQFNANQIQGLLLLQPKLIQELIRIFDLKSKQLGLVGEKLKVMIKNF